MHSFQYETKYAFKTRKDEAQKILDTHPTCTPLILESTTLTLNEPCKFKFLVPDEMTWSQFLAHVRRRLAGVTYHDAIFLFVDGEHLPPLQENIAQTYVCRKRDDHFLYVTVEREGTFG
jgi:hypothetical protein